MRKSEMGKEKEPMDKLCEGKDSDEDRLSRSVGDYSYLCGLNSAGPLIISADAPLSLCPLG